MNGVYPSCCYVGRCRKFPLSVIGPVAVVGFKQAFGIGSVFALRNGSAWEDASPKRHERNSAFKRAEVPIEEWAVEDKSVDGSMGIAREVVGGD